MAKRNPFETIKKTTLDRVAAIDKSVVMEKTKEQTQKATEFIGDKAAQIKGTAMAAKDDITEKLTELDRMLEASITEYNDVYTLMNDKGVQLFVERTRAVDSIGFVEELVTLKP